MKRCTGCEETKPLDQFYVKNRNKGDGRTPRCKACMNAYRKGRADYYNAKHREWTARNRDHLNAYNREWAKKQDEESKARKREYNRDFARRIQQQAIDAYGGFCACCGETERKFLQLDHMDNDGAAHRKKINGVQLGSWLKRQGYPKGFQVLCANCNFAKHTNGGTCPHQDALDKVMLQCPHGYSS